MDSILMERRICIDNDQLNSNIYTHILEKIKENTLNECTKEYGHILDIKKITRIKDNYISNVNCDTIFLVEFVAETLKPEIDKKFDGKVCMIFPGGIFLNIRDKQKVLIPISTLNNYKFDPANKSFKKDKKTIKEGDIIKVKITGTKYSKQSFSCFGVMIEDYKKGDKVFYKKRNIYAIIKDINYDSNSYIIKLENNDKIISTTDEFIEHI